MLDNEENFSQKDDDKILSQSQQTNFPTHEQNIEGGGDDVESEDYFNYHSLLVIMMVIAVKMEE